RRSTSRMPDWRPESASVIRSVDTLYSESLVLEKRESGSRPHAGIVTVHTRTLNQDGDEVCSFKRTFYVYKKGAPQLEGLFPTGKKPLTGDQGPSQE
ncbi:hypothetical protein ACWCSH_47325, partial [Streptosporangium sp. NPDC001682]